MVTVSKTEELKKRMGWVNARIVTSVLEAVSHAGGPPFNAF
jgi:hypothetical protein